MVQNIDTVVTVVGLPMETWNVKTEPLKQDLTTHMYAY